VSEKKNTRKIRNLTKKTANLTKEKKENIVATQSKQANICVYEYVDPLSINIGVEEYILASTRVMKGKKVWVTGQSRGVCSNRS